MSLKAAFRQVGFQCKYFMKMKESKTPKDLFALHDAIEEIDGQYHKVVFVGGQKHIQSVIADPNIIKRYYSEEIQDDKKYLGLMVLGLRMLEMVAAFDDLPEARKIYDDKLKEETEEYMHSTAHDQE